MVLEWCVRLYKYRGKCYKHVWSCRVSDTQIRWSRSCKPVSVCPSHLLYMLIDCVVLSGSSRCSSIHPPLSQPLPRQHRGIPVNEWLNECVFVCATPSAEQSDNLDGQNDRRFGVNVRDIQMKKREREGARTRLRLRGWCSNLMLFKAIWSPKTRGKQILYRRCSIWLW